MESKLNKTCSFCQNAKSDYCCPKCGLFYCSLLCYQHVNHMLCSESFYKGWIETTSLEFSDDKLEAKKKMYEILNRLKDSEELDSDDNSEDDIIDSHLSYLEKKFKEINLEEPVDYDKIWVEFTPEERDKIKQELEKENLENLVPTWKPWWESQPEKKHFVQEINREVEGNEELTENQIPVISKNIVPLTTLTKAKPSPSVKYNLINILGSYAYVSRRYNGDYVTEYLESVPLIINISGNLLHNKNYDTLDIAIFDMQNQDLSAFSVTLQRKELILIMHDICKLLEGSSEIYQTNYSQALISDMISLFKIFKSKIQLEKFQKEVLKLSEIIKPRKISLIIKKLEYFLSWMQSKETCKSLKKIIPEIQLLIANIVEDDASLKESRHLTLDKNLSSKVLVEEL